MKETLTHRINVKHTLYETRLARDACIFFFQNGGYASCVGSAGSGKRIRRNTELTETVETGRAEKSDEETAHTECLLWLFLPRTTIFPANNHVRIRANVCIAHAREFFVTT